MTVMTSHTLLYCSHAVLFYFSVSVFLVLAAHNDSDDLPYIIILFSCCTILFFSFCVPGVSSTQ